MAPVAINKKLNLVLPVETDAGKIWVHSVPISREVFESNYLLLTKTLAELYINGIGPAFGPRIAKLTLRDVAKEMNEEEDISINLINEVHRLTNFLMPSTNGSGWQTISLHEVIQKKLVDEAIISEVENAVIYFIVASAVHLKSELQMAMQGLKTNWKAQTTLLTVTEYGNSLMTSTPQESTGEKTIVAPQKPMAPRVSSVPS
jgi:hypothetical protein